KTFFAYTYEYMRQDTTVGSQISTVPTVDARRGDFSSLLARGSIYQIYDPATTTAAPNGRFSRRPFPGNIIPQSRFNPVAMNMFPSVYSLPSEGFNLATLGFPQSMINELAWRPPIAQVFPRVTIPSITGIPTYSSGTASSDDIHSWFVDVSRPVGSHSLKFGA